MMNANIEKEEHISKRFNDLFRMINYVRKLNEDLYRIKKIKKELEYAYLGGKIDETTYIKKLEMLKNEESKIESKVLILLGRIKESIRLLITDLKKDDVNRVVEKKQTLNVIREAINNITITYYPKYEREILEIEKELEKVEELKLIGKVKPIIEELERKRTVERVTIPKKKIMAKYSKKEFKVDIFGIITKISDMIFGNFSNEILNRSPNLYYSLRIYIRKTGLRLTPKTFLSVLLFFTTIAFTLGLVLFLLIFKVWAIVIPFLLVIIFLLLSFAYFEYSRNAKRNSIDRNLPFATIHMLSLLQTGISLEKVFYLLSEIKEYGYLSEEFGRIYNLLSLGASLTDSIIHVRDTTVSERLSEFLDELLLTLKSGRSVKDFLVTYTEMQLALYRSDLEKLNQAMKTFSDLYVGIVLTVPMIFVSISLMLSTISEKVFGMDLSQFLSMATLILIPLINLGFLMFVSKLEI